MAKGSEPAFKWSYWSGVRECSFCHRKLRIEDVGEFRTVMNPDGTKIAAEFLWCVDHRGGRERGVD